MTTSVITVRPDASVSDVAQLMHKYHFSGVPVVAVDKTVLGMISERDFITSGSGLYLPTFIKLISDMDYINGSRSGLPYSVRQVVDATAKDIMNKQVTFASPEMSINQLAELFAIKRSNPIPVTDGHNKLLGIISRSDLMKLFSEKELSQVKKYKPHDQSPVHSRMIDHQVEEVSDNLQTRFAYVAKAKANIWLTAAIVLFIIGFVFGVVYVADPDVLQQNTNMMKAGTDTKLEP